MKKIKSILIMGILILSTLIVLSPVSASCPTVVINEVNFDAGSDWLELYNYGPAVDMSGWTFTWEDEYQGPGTYTFPNGFVLGSKKFVLIIEWDDEEDPIPSNTESKLYFNQNIGWSDGENNTARLLDKNGKCVDYVRMETDDEEFPGNPIPANCSWGPPNITDTDPYDYVFRNSDNDTNTGSDWTRSNDGTPLALNPGQTGQSSCNSKALPMDWIMKKFGLGNKDKE